MRRRRRRKRSFSELDAEKAFGRPIVTQVRPAEEFYRAEDYHQNYFRDNPKQTYCSYIVAPKAA